MFHVVTSGGGRAWLPSITKDIKDIHQELQSFKNDMMSEMEKYLSSFREEIKHKLEHNNKELQKQKAKLAEASCR